MCPDVRGREGGRADQDEDVTGSEQVEPEQMGVIGWYVGPAIFIRVSIEIVVARGIPEA